MSSPTANARRRARRARRGRHLRRIQRGVCTVLEASATAAEELEQTRIAFPARQVLLVSSWVYMYPALFRGPGVRSWRRGLTGRPGRAQAATLRGMHPSDAAPTPKPTLVSACVHPRCVHH